MTEDEKITDLDAIDMMHCSISRLVGGEWGIAWTYSTRRFGIYVILTATIPNRQSMIAVETTAVDIIGCLIRLELLLRKSHERSAEKHVTNTTPDRPTENELRSMDCYFKNNQYEYKTVYARQLSQGVIMPYDTLTDKDRERLYYIWKTTQKNKGNYG